MKGVQGLLFEAIGKGTVNNVHNTFWKCGRFEMPRVFKAFKDFVQVDQNILSLKGLKFANRTFFLRSGLASSSY